MLEKQQFFIDRLLGELKTSYDIHQNISRINWSNELAQAGGKIALGGGAGFIAGALLKQKKIGVAAGAMVGLGLVYKQLQDANNIATQAQQVSSFLDIAIENTVFLTHAFYRVWFLPIEMLEHASILSLITVFAGLLQQAASSCSQEDMEVCRQNPKKIMTFFWGEYKKTLIQFNKNPSQLAEYFGIKNGLLTQKNTLKWQLDELFFNGPILLMEEIDNNNFSLEKFSTYIDRCSTKRAASGVNFFKTVSAEGSHKYPCRVLSSRETMLGSTIGYIKTKITDKIRLVDESSANIISQNITDNSTSFTIWGSKRKP